MTGGVKGITLALANTLVIAVCIAIRERDPEAVIIVALIASLPAVVTGGIVGLLVGAMPAQRVWWRLLVVTLPALALVVVLGEELAMGRYVVLASIPTLVACSILEKWTRAPRDAALPVARVS